MGCGLVHGAEGEADGSTCAICQRPDPSTNSPARQEFHDVHFSGNSRTHIGNVYNTNTYIDDNHTRALATKAQNLMMTLEFDGMRDRLYTVSPACANTCNWFLKTQEYTTWRNPDCRVSHHGVLWIKGKAGTGKSTLMRYIHDHAEKSYQGSTVISFFFNGRSHIALAKSTEGMYRSLLHQLYDNKPYLKEAAARKALTTKQQTLSLGVLEDMFRQTVLGLALTEGVTCYIDALDECPIDQVRLAIQCFESLSQATTREQVPFSICFSSRYYPHITISAHVESKLDNYPEHLQDIVEYLDHRLSIPLAMKREMGLEIEARCSGVFLWVVLVVDMLRNSSDEGATRSQLHSLLKSLPSELEALFASISHPADASFVIAMRWMLFSRRTLYLEELYFAIRSGLKDLTSAFWDQDEVNADAMHKYILHVSRGLIECRYKHESRPSLRIPQLVHESVREYLLSGYLANLECVPGQDLATLSHAKMIKDCQFYLELCVHGQRSLLEIEERKDDFFQIGAKYPLATYATWSGLDHLEIAWWYGSCDIDLVNFPVRNFTIVRQNMGGDNEYGYSCVPGHPANLLTYLIDSRFFELAEYYLQTTKWSRDSAAGYIEPCEPCTVVARLSRSRLSTCCENHDRNSLQAAIGRRQIHLVRMLLEYGAEVNPVISLPEDDLECEEYVGSFMDDKYVSPLMQAVGYLESEEMARLLLDHGADVNYVDPFTDVSPLHSILESEPNHDSEQKEIVKLLLSRGAHVNRLCGAGWRRQKKKMALHLFLGQRNALDRTDVLRMLLEAGANVNDANACDETPLLMAVCQEGFDAAKMLLDYGANAEYRSTHLGTAITAAHISILKPLLLEIRLRALKGRDGFLPLAIRPNLPAKRKASRIPVPLQSFRRRKERPLQYRRPPRCRRLYYADLEDANMDSSRSLDHKGNSYYYGTIEQRELQRERSRSRGRTHHREFFRAESPA